ncbi:MAG: isoprenylcysteine carboxylmethyltransferase family protein [Deltaproteobacteria bacterium]|nr:isoprenylcysteine carboxylmethyltransferase family protein [Deltaproteobacteria bacterium]
MTALDLKAFAGLLNLVAIMGLALFLSAGTIHYPQAWTFLAVFFVAVTAITVYLMKKDPALLARRVQAGPVAEQRTLQKVIQAFASLAFLAFLVVPGLDRRWGWSSVPIFMSVVGDVWVAVGLLIIYFVFRSNTFTSATVEVGAGQKVISAGPYGMVRHPMYAGALLMLAAMPIALGSWWAEIALLPMLAVIVSRLLDEERLLARELEGYPEYQRRVKWRLVPGVW